MQKLTIVIIVFRGLLIDSAMQNIDRMTSSARGKIEGSESWMTICSGKLFWSGGQNFLWDDQE